MEASGVPLICYFDGKLSDEDKNAKYTGGTTKGGRVPKSILFTRFKEKIQELINLPSNGMEIKIKCGVRFDELLIGMDVDDDNSLRFVMDHSKIILADILKYVPPVTTFAATQWGDPMPPSASIQSQDKNLIDGTSDNKSVEVNTTEVKPPDNDGTNANKDASPSQSKLRQWFPETLLPIITGYENPEGDGNCGFRALCMALGKTESKWSGMRAELVKEINSHIDFYHQLFTVEETCTLLQRTQHQHGRASPPNWMAMPSTGFVFAQAFEKVLVYYSDEICCTFVPFLSPPNTEYVHVKVLGIGLVENNHYIKLDFRDGCPLPPFPHIPSKWRAIRLEVANCWEKLLRPRMVAFGKIKLPEELLMIEDFLLREDPVSPSAASLRPAKNFGVKCIDGTRNSDPVEDVSELADVNRIDSSGADINRPGDMHDRFSRSNVVDHHREEMNLPISNQQDDKDNKVHMQEEMPYGENQVTSEMEQMMPPSTADVCIPTIGYEPPPLKFSDYGFVKGREFPNINALKNALSDMAIETKRVYKHVRTCPSKLIMKCRESSCAWSVQATRLQDSPALKVTKYHEWHTCAVHTKNDHPQATVKWILSKLQSYIEKNPYMEPKKIVKEIKDRYGIEISYNKVVKAKTEALELMRNRLKGTNASPHPDICRALIQELERGGTICKLGLNSDGGSFQHLFWAFSACVEALRNHLRPVVYVGTIPTGIGVLMYALGVDGGYICNKGYVEVGFAYCVREDVESWEAFLGWLKEFVLPPTAATATGNYNNNTVPFAIVTEFKEAALTRAVHNVLPPIHHFFNPCFFFFEDDIYSDEKDPCSIFKNDQNLRNLCRKACETLSTERCESYLQEIKMLNKEAYEWLESFGSKSHWTIAFSPNKHVRPVPWGLYVERLESMLAQDKMSIVEIVESSREKVAYFFSYRRREGAEDPDWTPRVNNDIYIAKLPGGYDVVASIGGDKYQVTHSTNNDTWAVDLKERSCTCGKFQATEYPCLHAMVPIARLHLDAGKYFNHRWYSLDTYLATYAGTLPPPIRGIIPPKRTRVGRPRKLRKTY